MPRREQFRASNRETIEDKSHDRKQENRLDMSASHDVERATTKFFNAVAATKFFNAVAAEKANPECRAENLPCCNKILSMDDSFVVSFRIL